MATRDLEKRIAALEAQQAGAELDWVPLVNCCRRLLGEPEVPHTPKPGCRRARIEDWVWLRDAAAEPETASTNPLEIICMSLITDDDEALSTPEQRGAD